jgi:hypothetical protein
MRDLKEMLEEVEMNLKRINEKAELLWDISEEEYSQYFESLSLLIYNAASLAKTMQQLIK